MSSQRPRSLKGFAQILTLSAVLCGPAMSNDILPNQDDFDERVRAFLMANPEVILEALEALSAREAAAQMRLRIAEFPDLFARPPMLGLGSEEAQLRVVEFFDYKCVPCKAVHETLESLTETNPRLRIEMRQLPILTPASERATRFAFAALEAYDVAIYQNVHEALWQHKGPYSIGSFARISEKLGIDFGKIEAVMWSDTVSQRIETNRNIALSLELIGTPAFVTTNAVSIGQTDPAHLSELFFSQ